MSRVSTTPDVNRISEAVSRPGIDPRTWKSLAVVAAVHNDPGHGPFADLVLIPSGARMTARFGAPYAGNGFGAYFPVEVDDEVVVGVPDGDPQAGGVILGRLWSGGDPPPREIIDHPSDVLVLAKAGQTVRIVVDGAGDAVVAARGSGHVRLGDEAADRGVARIEDQVKLHLAELQACLDTRYQLRPSPPPLDLTAYLPGVSGEVTTASDKVKSS